MGQLSTNNKQIAFVYDFSVNGGAVGTISLGGALNGGQTIVGVYYTVISAITTAAVNIDAGYGYLSGVGMIDAAHTVAVLNAAIGFWKQNTGWTMRKIAIGSTLDTSIVLSTPNAITAGKMVISFAVMQHPM